ncbi:MAG: PAS domain-containing protein, partial [Gammaproteobacteria bacterium]|nr:PAS domain-containing protein [Gammaproteobacteria bacterium]
MPSSSSQSPPTVTPPLLIAFLAGAALTALTYRVLPVGPAAMTLLVALALACWVVYKRPFRGESATRVMPSDGTGPKTPFEEVLAAPMPGQDIVHAPGFLSAVINAVPGPIFVKDEAHRWIVLNDAMCRFMGQPRERLLGKTDHDFFPKEEADVFRAKDEEVFASDGPNVNDESFTDANGVTHWIMTRKACCRLPGGQRILVGVITDMTEHRRNDQALRESEQRMRALLDGMPDRVWLKDQTGRYIDINRSEELAFGIPASEVLGKTVFELRPADQAALVHAEDQRVMHSGEPSRTERVANLGQNWVDVIKAPIRDKHGRVVGLVGISRDVTERKHAEERLREAMQAAHAASMAKSEFVANMSHE